MSKKVAGPKGLPLIGCLNEFRNDSLGFLSRTANEFGDISRFYLPGRTITFVTHPDNIRDLFVIHHKSLEKGTGFKRLSPLLGQSMLIAEGERHRRLRRLSQPAFNKKNLLAYDRFVTEEAGLFSKDLVDGCEIDMAEEMMGVTLRVVARALLGSDIREECKRVTQSLDAALKYWAAGFNPFTRIILLLPTATRRDFFRGRRELFRIVENVIRARRDQPGEHHDLLAKLSQAGDATGEQGLSDEELRNEIITLILAGHETTANAMAWTWYLLSENPHVEAQLHAELEQVLGGNTPTSEDLDKLVYTRQVFTESMRLYSPVWPSAGKQLQISPWARH